MCFCLYLHSHKKWSDSLETWTVLLIFSLQIKTLEVFVQTFIKTAKFGGFCEELFSENNSEAFSVTFSCYDYGIKKDRYRSKRVLQMFLVCYNLLQKLLRKKSKEKNLPLVSFYPCRNLDNNGWGIALKPEVQNPKQHFRGRKLF